MSRVINRQCALSLCVGAVIFLGEVLLTSRAEAASFAFVGVDKDGTGSAMMDIDIVGNTLTVTLDNTSPTTLNSSPGLNAPAIRGFGFSIDPNLTPLSWTLTAFADAAQTSLITLGDLDGSADLWTMGTSLPSSVTRDFLPQSNSKGSKGSIHNPAADAAALGAGPNYFSAATLVMTFATAPMLDVNVSPYVRMQRVGSGRKGSLKLFGTPTTTAFAGPSAPEPTSLAMFGIGMVCCSGYVIRRKRKKLAA